MHYFNYAAVLEEEREMKKLGQKLPTKADFEAALQALPGKYEQEAWYKGGNIFHLLFNGKNKHTGYCRSDGSLDGGASNSFLWSFTNDARAFMCDKSECKLARGNIDSAHALRGLVQ